MSGPAWHEGESLELTDSSADTVSEALVATMSRVMSATTGDSGDETGNAAAGMSSMGFPGLWKWLEAAPCCPLPVPSEPPRGRQKSMPTEYERGADAAEA